ncbi:MAG: PQQ-binding-like beta-propeller repeat protein [Cytophagales bacterium]|nr:PQQ-binding-like beta-propeller repeat protein [Cytophagales bacterium]
MWVGAPYTEVRTFVRNGNTLYLGGSFTYLGPTTGNGAVITLDGKVLPAGLSRINGNVYSAEPDGKGGWFVSGQLTADNGTASYFLRHLLPGGRPDPNWKVAVSGAVGGMTRGAGNVLYLHGLFGQVNGQPRQNLAAIDAATGAVLPWNPTTPDGGVSTLLVAGDTVYLAGNFRQINNQARTSLAAVNAHTGALLPWAPNVVDRFNNAASVRTLVLQGHVLYIGGSFISVNGQNRSSLAALSTQTALPEPWNPYVDGSVNAMAMVGNALHIGGFFNIVGTERRNYLAAVDVTTGQPTPWNPNLNETVSRLALANNILYACGSFTTVGQERRGRMAAFDVTTGQLTAWRPSANSAVNTLSVSGDAIYVGGEFTSIGGESRAYAAAIDVTTKTLTAWNPRPDGPVNEMVLHNNTVYLAGSFGQVGGAVRGNLAAVDATTGTPTSWNPQTDQMVNGCTLFNNTLYLYGFFTNVNGQPRRSAAAVDALTGALKDWNPAPDSYVYALATNGRRVFLGGTFNAVGGQPRNGLAAVDPVTGAVAAWNTGITGAVDALLLSGNTLYAGGSFSLAANGQSRNGLAAFHTGTGQVKPWNPVLVYAPEGAATPGMVNALGLSGSTLYAGGLFTTVGGQVRKGIAALDTTTAVPTPWNPTLTNGTAGIIVPAGDALYVGGDFTKVNQRHLPSLAAWYVNGPPPPRYNTIRGTVFDDKNRDCASNAGDAGLPDVVVVAEPGAHYALTNSLGRYTISADTGVYTVTQLLSTDKARLIREACQPARTVALKTYGNDLTGQDFGIRVTPCAFLDVQVTSTERRRCAAGKTTIHYCNTGAAPAAGAKVYLKLPAHIVLVGADRSFTADKDKNYVFDVGTLEPGQCGTLSVADSVVCNDPGIRGLTQCTRVWITPANRCMEPSPDWDGSDVALRATCLNNGVVRLSLRNVGTGDMADSTEFRVRLDARLASPTGLNWPPATASSCASPPTARPSGSKPTSVRRTPTSNPPT